MGIEETQKTHRVDHLQCDFCDKSFSEYESLKGHLKFRTALKVQTVVRPKMGKMDNKVRKSRTSSWPNLAKPILKPSQIPQKAKI